MVAQRAPYNGAQTHAEHGKAQTHLSHRRGGVKFASHGRYGGQIHIVDQRGEGSYNGYENHKQQVMARLKAVGAVGCVLRVGC